MTASTPPHIDWADFALPPLATPPNADIVTCLQTTSHTAAEPWLDATMCIGVSPASQFAQHGVPAVLFGPSTGPGLPCLAHCPDEAVDLDQVHKAARIYARAAIVLLRSRVGGRIEHR